MPPEMMGRIRPQLPLASTPSATLAPKLSVPWLGKGIRGVVALLALPILFSPQIADLLSSLIDSRHVLRLLLPSCLVAPPAVALGRRDPLGGPGAGPARRRSRQPRRLVVCDQHAGRSVGKSSGRSTAASAFAFCPRCRQFFLTLEIAAKLESPALTNLRAQATERTPARVREDSQARWLAAVAHATKAAFSALILSPATGDRQLWTSYRSRVVAPMTGLFWSER